MVTDEMLACLMLSIAPTHLCINALTHAFYLKKLQIVIIPHK